MRKHILIGALAALAAGFPVDAQRARPGWTGLWGPGRNASVEGPKAPTALKELWRKPSAGGYSEVVSIGERAYTLELKDGVDFVVAFETQSGRETWRTRIAETYRGHDGSHDGPISPLAGTVIAT